MQESLVPSSVAVKNPSVFISYSWDSEAHKQWVLKLAIALQERGINTFIDQWDIRPGMDLQEYMEYSVRSSDFVLLVCTPNYAVKANEGQGGVGYEKAIITGEIFLRTKPNARFVPLVREGEASGSLPSFLRSRVFIDFRRDEAFEASLEELLRHLFDQPRSRRPPLGPAPSLADLNLIPLPPPVPKSTTPNTVAIHIGNAKYEVTLPDWWTSVNVSLPQHIKSEAEVREFVSSHFGSDMGTESTWRAAWKIWLEYYLRTGGIPVYVAHCYNAGGDHENAIKLYAEMFEFAGLTDEPEWYATYLAYEAGRAYHSKGQTELARLWFAKAAQHKESADRAVAYYAEVAEGYRIDKIPTNR